MKYCFFPGCTLKTAAGYKESIEAVLSHLGLSIPEIENWSCCGATVYFSLDELVALVLPARVMAMAEEMESEVLITPCNACYATLRKARDILADNEELKHKVNEALNEENRRYKGKVKIRHLLDYFLDPEVKEILVSKIVNPLDGLKLAPYYGCQYTRPQVEDEDHAERPKALDHLLELLKAEVVDFTAKTYCCGAAQIVAHEEACLPLVRRILIDAQKKGAKAIVAICPLCQLNLETREAKVGISKIPVVFFTQLMGIALGIDKKNLGLDKLLVPLKEAV